MIGYNDVDIDWEKYDRGKIGVGGWVTWNFNSQFNWIAQKFFNIALALSQNYKTVSKCYSNSSKSLQTQVFFPLSTIELKSIACIKISALNNRHSRGQEMSQKKTVPSQSKCAVISHSDWWKILQIYRETFTPHTPVNCDKPHQLNTPFGFLFDFLLHALKQIFSWLF